MTERTRIDPRLVCDRCGELCNSHRERRDHPWRCRDVTARAAAGAHRVPLFRAWVVTPIPGWTPGQAADVPPMFRLVAPFDDPAPLDGARAVVEGFNREALVEPIETSTGIRWAVALRARDEIAPGLCLAADSLAIAPKAVAL